MPGLAFSPGTSSVVGAPSPSLNGTGTPPTGTVHLRVLTLALGLVVGAVEPVESTVVVSSPAPADLAFLSLDEHAPSTNSPASSATPAIRAARRGVRARRRPSTDGTASCWGTAGPLVARCGRA